MSEQRRLQQRSRGFSLLESLISLSLLSVGILGIAALLTQGYASIKTSGMRTIAALQASSLASAMYANHAFWANAKAGDIRFSATGTTINASQGLEPASTLSCKASTSGRSPCTPAAIAAVDVAAWSTSVSSALASVRTAITCTTPSNQPRSCAIEIRWSERFLQRGALRNADGSIDNQALASTATQGERTYILRVQP